MGVYLTVVVLYLAVESWQIGLLVIAVAAATFALRHRSAHIRHLLWLIVIAKCLVPPLYAVPLRILPGTEPQGPLCVVPPWHLNDPNPIDLIPPDTLSPLQGAFPFWTSRESESLGHVSVAVGLARRAGSRQSCG